MTDEEKTLQTQMLGEMKAHLILAIGYPNCTNEQIMAQVPYMWNVLVHKKLTRPGMTYELFVHSANKIYTKYEINRMIGI